MSSVRTGRMEVLTGGGDYPGLNAVIRAVTKIAAHRFGMGAVGINEGFDGLIHGGWRELTEREVSGILRRGGTILGTTNRDNPFHYLIREDEHGMVYADLSDVVVENFRRLELDAPVVIGGEASLRISLELYRKGIPLVGIPKTIDNDIMATTSLSASIPPCIPPQRTSTSCIPRPNRITA